MTIREELEKHFEEKFGVTPAYYAMLDAYYEGARWMADRLKNECGGGMGYVTATEIRQLKKEIEP